MLARPRALGCWESNSASLHQTQGASVGVDCHHWFMSRLDPNDAHWAAEYGATWGATWAEPAAAPSEIMRAFADDVNPPLNARTIAYGKRELNIAEDGQLSDKQKQDLDLASYLHELSAVALRQGQLALWWRRDKLVRGEADPGVEYLSLRADQAFRDHVEAQGPAHGIVAVTPNAVGSSDETAAVTPEVALPWRKRRRLEKLDRAEQRRIEKSKQEQHQEYAQAKLKVEEERSHALKVERDEKRRIEKFHRDAPKRLDQALKKRRKADALRLREQQKVEKVRLREEQAAETLRQRAEQQEQIRQLPPAPAAQPYGVNHQGAERFAADWMRHLGALDARVTQYSGDGGIDVESKHVVVQVKNLHSSRSVKFSEIRDLLGTATHRHKIPVMFTSGGVSKDGLRFANETGIVLLQYNAEKGTVVGLNTLGWRARRHGLLEEFGFDHN